MASPKPQPHILHRHPMRSLQPESRPPKASWWLTETREQFAERQRQEARRMRGSQEEIRYFATLT